MSVALNHPITPRLGTTRKPDGAAASVLITRDYPIVAECLSCGGFVRTDRYGGGWYHVTQRPDLGIYAPG